MKNLLKLTVVALSIFAFAQAEAAYPYWPPCKNGDHQVGPQCVSFAGV
jgi:hypothetical protein